MRPNWISVGGWVLNVWFFHPLQKKKRVWSTVIHQTFFIFLQSLGYTEYTPSSSTEHNVAINLTFYLSVYTLSVFRYPKMNCSRPNGWSFGCQYRRARLYYYVHIICVHYTLHLYVRNGQSFPDNFKTQRLQ